MSVDISNPINQSIKFEFSLLQLDKPTQPSNQTQIDPFNFPDIFGLTFCTQLRFKSKNPYDLQLDPKP